MSWGDFLRTSMPSPTPVPQRILVVLNTWAANNKVLPNFAIGMWRQDIIRVDEGYRVLVTQEDLTVQDAVAAYKALVRIKQMSSGT